MIVQGLDFYLLRHSLAFLLPFLLSFFLYLLIFLKIQVIGQNPLRRAPVQQSPGPWGEFPAWCVRYGHLFQLEVDILRQGNRTHNHRLASI